MKICYMFELARRIGVPIIGLNDSVGGRIQEGLRVGYGPIFYQNSITQGWYLRSRRLWALVLEDRPILLVLWILFLWLKIHTCL